MKKPKMPLTASRPTLKMQLANAEQRLQQEFSISGELRSKLDNRDREEGRLANENTRLGKIIEGLKEELFNKSLALALAEGKLERVDHEDAERAEVVILQDMRTTRVNVHGTDCAGPPIPIQRAVLKYDLASSPLRESQHSNVFNNYTENHHSGVVTERPKHWVNQH